jgi:acetoacetyl-CoA synthetase
MVNNNVIWEPPKENFTHSHLSKLIKMLPAENGLEINDWATLQRFAIDKPEQFWRAIIDYAGIKFQCPPKTITAGKELPEVNWLPGATLNFAENLLAPVLTAPPQTDRIVCYREDGQVKRYSNATLAADVAGLSAWLRDIGVRSGDRVAGILGHGYEAIVGMLATTCVGGIWSSASPDFGVEAIVDRFDQIEPSVLIVSNGYTYSGKRYDRHNEINALNQRITSIKKILIVDQGFDCRVRLPKIAERFDAALTNYQGATLEFTPVPSHHPVYILFSSGTTGRPKCIVHGTGGILLNHASELLFHADLNTNDRFFYFTTCGWMMWNWQISGLMADATLITYDGSPSYPSLDRLWNLCAKEKISHFGTSAKFLASCRQQNLKPTQTHDLSSLKIVFSTGSPLLPSEFDWFYEYGAPKALLGSIIGGTDICGCFLGSNPLLPVRRGEIQAPMLGKDIAAFNEAGKSVKEDRGELVCRNAVPSMPVGFWNDADGTRYRKAYFQRFPGVWAHGDFIGFTPSGGAIIYGRSDTTLNPGGVRIGTAEIYRQVEIITPIADCLVAGRPIDGDEEVVLLVKLNDDEKLDNDLRMQIKTQIRVGASPRHVPRHIIQVPDIPYSRSGKKVEIAVAQMLRHQNHKDNVSALANPEALIQILESLINEGLINPQAP